MLTLGSNIQSKSERQPMTTKNDDLRGVLNAIRDMPATAREKRSAILNARSRNILHDDLGEFTDSIEFNYYLDDPTRDRLIAHTRQDTAMNFNAIEDVYLVSLAAKRYSMWAMVFAFIGMMVSIGSNIT